MDKAEEIDWAQEKEIDLRLEEMFVLSLKAGFMFRAKLEEIFLKLLGMPSLRRERWWRHLRTIRKDLARRKRWGGRRWEDEGLKKRLDLEFWGRLLKELGREKIGLDNRGPDERKGKGRGEGIITKKWIKNNINRKRLWKKSRKIRKNEINKNINISYKSKYIN